VKPYYQDSAVTIYHGDCREVLPELLKVDLILTDPPYGIAYDGSHSKYLNGIDRGPCEWDKEPFDPAFMIGRAKGHVIWGGNCFSSRLPDSPAWLAWVKTARDDADIRQSDLEFAWTDCIGRPRVFHHLWIGAYKASESGIRNDHPTQKPLELMRWCIQLVKPAPNFLLDPFMGSGTTLRAAKDLGRKAIGIEIEERYCEIAARRMAQEVLEIAA
jgi:DNA modification methylase